MEKYNSVIGNFTLKVLVRDGIPESHIYDSSLVTKQVTSPLVYLAYKKDLSGDFAKMSTPEDVAKFIKAMKA